MKARRLKISGRKEELVSRVFCAVENNVPVLKSVIEIENDLSKEYQNKLINEGEKLPDPLSLENDWINEDEGKKCWPLINYPDIFTCLTFKPAELGSNDLSDYKTCKAYSYFKSGWLQPFLYHDISSDSKYCYIRRYII